MRADAHELRFHADLLEQPREVDVLGAEAGVAETARRVDDDAIGVGAHVERARAVVLEAAENLLAARAEHADGVGELFGVCVRCGGLGPKDEGDRVDAARLGELPQLAEQGDVSPRAGRRLDADGDGVLDLGEPGLPDPRIGQRAEAGDVVGAAHAAAEQQPAARGEVAERELEAHRGGDAAHRVVVDVGDLDVPARTTHVRDVEGDARAGEPQVAVWCVGAFEVPHVDGDLEGALACRANGGRHRVAAVEERLAVGQRRALRSIEVVHDQREPDVWIGPEARADRDAEEAVEERRVRERPLDRGAERPRVVQVPREPPREPRVRRVSVDGVCRARREDVVHARGRGEPEPQRRARFEDVAAVDLLGAVAVDPDVAQLPRRHPPEVGGVDAERFDSVLARCASPDGVDALDALRLGRIRPRDGCHGEGRDA